MWESTWFQLVRRGIAMPQVSVTPAKTRPAPTNAAKPRNPDGRRPCARSAEDDQRSGGDPHLAFE